MVMFKVVTFWFLVFWRKFWFSDSGGISGDSGGISGYSGFGRPISEMQPACFHVFPCTPYAMHFVNFMKTSAYQGTLSAIVTPLRPFAAVPRIGSRGSIASP
jgi:hypothetical protein